MDNVTLIRAVTGATVVFVFLPLLIVPYWKIFSKAGFRGTLAFLMLVPVVNLIVLYYVDVLKVERSRRCVNGHQVYWYGSIPSSNRFVVALLAYSTCRWSERL
jgi:hypothetical protein